MLLILSSLKAESGRLLGIHSQAGLQSQFRDRLGYMEKPKGKKTYHMVNLYPEGPSPPKSNPSQPDASHLSDTPLEFSITHLSTKTKCAVLLTALSTLSAIHTGLTPFLRPL